MPKHHANQHESTPQTMLNRTTKQGQTSPKTTTEAKTEPKKQTEKERREPKKFFLH